MTESRQGESGPSSTWRPLGAMLVEEGRVGGQAVSEALSLQKSRPERIGELLCRLGHVDARTVREALVRQAGIPTVDLDRTDPSAAAVAAVAADVAYRHKILPFEAVNGELSVAMADPFDRSALETVRVLTGKRIRRFYCGDGELNEALRRTYGSSVARMVAEMDSPPSGQGDVEPTDLASRLEQMAREPSVVNLVNLLILEAIEARASDIHIEPFEKRITVKYRVDGVLHEVSPPGKHLQPAMVSRVKIMAGMNIAERFVPQDGHITFDGPRGRVDLRVATVPTVFGECVAMRILDRSAALIDMEKLGMNPQVLRGFQTGLERPHGIVLVTGPTGSGKTTTLYAALNRIYTPEKKIITIEDPVEYELEGINQIPVNRKRGLGFANGLRSILRQDPDIIMVGEIRDRETADIAIRSALTGHLVFSTLHTNDAPGAVARLLDMGVEPFLLASSLEAVVAQRLVRQICDSCREPHRPEEAALHRVGHRLGNGSGGTFFRGKGCRACRQTGYAGRIGIFELLRVNQAVREAIVRRSGSDELVRLAPKGHEPMSEDGYRKAAEGVTTLEEVLRVTQDTRAEEALGTDD